MLDFFKNMFMKKPKEIETCNTEIGILDIKNNYIYINRYIILWINYRYTRS